MISGAEVVDDLREFIETFNVVCPACQGQVEAREGGVLCLQCRRLYAIEDGIPALVAEEATRENEEPPQTA